MKLWANKQSGFTIVELLIVIVVIAILAAITIVAYNGIQNRAKASAAQSSVAQASKKVMSYAVENSDDFPPDLDAVGIKNSTDVSYEYSFDNNSTPKTYCITATRSNVSYYFSSTSSAPTSGGCAGHGVNGVSAITNLTTNPGFESTAGTGNPNTSDCVVSLSTDAQSGTRSLLLAKGNNYCFKRVLTTVAGTSMSGKTYRVAAWVKTPAANVYTVYRANGSGYAGATLTTTPNVWTYVTRTFTVAPTDTQTPTFDIGYENAQLASGSNFQIDSVMITEGTTTYTYADGNSPGWAWSGTVNNSTSSGVPQ